MDALVDEIVQKVGLTRTQAEQAARVTVGFLKERLPAQASGQIDGVLGAAQTESTAEQVRGKVEGFFR